MRNKFPKLLALIAFLFATFNITAQNKFFSDIPELQLKNTNLKRVIRPSKYRTFQLDTTLMLQALKASQSERSVFKNRSIISNIITIPMPDGTNARFNIWESSVMEPELAAQFPQIKTYTGQGIDDKTATIKIDWTELGFHAMILSPVTTSVFIDNYAQGDKVNYISYFKSDFVKTSKFIEGEIRRMNNTPDIAARPSDVLAKQCRGSQLRTYRLAVACTAEYAIAATGKASPTVAEALSAINTTVNRVNGVYEKEIDLRIVLINTETKIIFTKIATEPFTDNPNDPNGPNVLLRQSQKVIDSAIGNANYDMGHTFSTSGGGLSLLGVICQTGYKAQSITGSDTPVGDPYDIDYVAHEMGHSIGAEHTFNSVLDACYSNGSKKDNAEPGSGSTIMAYAGICGTDDLQPHTDPQFHALSFDEITTYIFNNTGSTCGTLTSTGNTPPVVNAGGNYIIPKSTPFVLTGSATDADADTLTYSWEQVDVGGAFGAWNAPSGNAPLFRSFAPVLVPYRYFPKLSDVINNTTTKGELLPTYARTMHFRLTASDNKAAGGGVCFAEMTATVNATAGPFVVTYPNATGISWNAGESRTITWDTAFTKSAPVSCANVSIQLSTDGGLTFPITILASTPNDGSEAISVPANITTKARIRVIAVGNVFYDMSNNNFTIVNNVPTFNFNVPDSVKVCGANSGLGKLASTSFAGYNNPIIVSASGNPSGTTVTLSNNTINPGDTLTVTLNNTNTLADGVYPVTITGISSSVTRSQPVIFIVGTTPGTPTLTAPANLATGISTLPNLSWSAVPSTAYYTLEVSLSNTFATILQTVTNISTNNYTLKTALAQNTIYYWRVKATNYCGTSGATAAQFLFKTGLGGCTTFTNSAVPKTISGTGTPTVTSTLTIPTASGVTISDINVVGLVGTHTWISDLTVSLISPDTTSVILFDEICNDGNQYQNFNINLDDEASLTTFPCPPTGNLTVVPVNPLAEFAGKSSAGTWTLKVTDNYNQYGGRLTGWGLQICSITSTPLDPVYTFNGNGNWTDAANWVNGSIPPATAITGSQINIDPVSGGACTLNIPYVLATGSTITVMTNKNFIVQGNLTIQNN